MNEWTTWNGGDMPVDGETFVNIKAKEITPNPDVGFKANTLDWEHEGYWSDIIAYRVSKGE